MKGLIGKKVGMTHIFDERGAAIPVTVIEAGPCYVTQIKTKEKDGYSAVQLGYQEVDARKLNLPERGHLKAASKNLRVLREFRTLRTENLELGQCLKVDVFAAGDWVDIIGTSKGRGFAGVIKRHGFSRQPTTHGMTDRTRTTGSIGACTYPGHVIKGKKMPGHMGSVRVTSQNVRVVIADAERNLLAVLGSVPGPNGGLVLIQEGRKQ
ncbi:MAG: 50S ribosomal protein L3 [Anaerolineae bacterium]|nr:50S ribosomal protein L3 [Anaerolineae bacterium]